MEEAQFSIIAGAIIAIIVIVVLVPVVTRPRINRKLRYQRNLLYPLKQFQLACVAPELAPFISELANECIFVIFPRAAHEPTLAKYAVNLASEEIERICIEHSKKIVDKIALLTTPHFNLRKFRDQRPQALLFLARLYLRQSLTQEGKLFWRQLVDNHKEIAYQLLISQAQGDRKALAVIYGDEFFAQIADLQELEKYPRALEYLCASYLDNKNGANATKLIEKLMNKEGIPLYRRLVGDMEPQNPRLHKIYHDEFFQRVNTLEQLEKYPQVMPFLIKNYLLNRTQKNATATLEKLISKHPQHIYRLLFDMIYKNNNKEFALEMIQNYPHIPANIKIGILRCLKGDRYVDASIDKMRREQNAPQEWAPLFDTIAQILGKKTSVPTDATEVKRIKKLLEFQRDNANSIGNMLKVLDLEKLIENLDIYYGERFGK